MKQMIMLKNSIYIMNHFDKRFDNYRNMKNPDWHPYSQFGLAGEFYFPPSKI